jgi:hypothetical protein
VANQLQEFQRLCDRRDLAAYRVAGTVSTVIAFWECQSHDEALALLKTARDEFDAAANDITEFLNSKKESQSDGNDNSSAA